MSLAPGVRIGPFEVVSRLGAGGMGEVYLARDARLEREVALKTLPEAFTRDAERRARLEREARLLAALSHPNVASLFGIEDSDGTPVLVMELVPGATLAERLQRGPMPVREALEVARQVAEGLEAAHRKGIIHRDLKPANVKLTAEGRVKVLDFGLAKALSAALVDDPQEAETASRGETGSGAVMGTAAYMSPEQARGEELDERTDMWSFGCLLYESLTGRRAFAGATASDTLAAVLEHAPDWSVLPAATPALVRSLLRLCLQKDRKERLADIADARLEIVDALSAPSSDARVMSAGEPQPAWRRIALPVIASFVVGGIAVGLAAWAVTKNSRDGSSASVVRFAIHDTDRIIVSRAEGDMALSPHGRTLAFVGLGEGGSRIWIRALDALDARSLPGTEGAAGLCWSPDGRSLAFIADGRVSKVLASGGSPEVVERGPSTRRTGSGASSMTWGLDGTILYVDNNGFWRVPASGGARTRMTARSPDEVPGSPAFLPDGSHFLISVRSADPAKAGTFVTALNESTRTRVLPFPASARYAAERLLFIRDGGLYAQSFDMSHMNTTGDPVPLADNVAAFGVSDSGVAAYLSSSDQSSGVELLWRDRGGQVLGRIDQARGANWPSLSPDQGRLALTLRGDIWIFELARGVLSRLTTGGGNNPTWSADGQRLMFARGGFRNGKDFIFETPVVSAGKENVLREPTGEHAHPTDASADGKFLIYDGEEDGSDIWVLPLTGDRKPSAYVHTPSIETQGTLSHDGRWLAYTSDNSGRFEVYVQSFPEPGPRSQVSPNGGSSARWRRDGKELFYLAPDGTLMAVPVRSTSTIEFGSPTALFQFQARRGVPATRPFYDVTADGQRFIASAVVRRIDPSLYVLLNWPSLVAAPKP